MFEKISKISIKANGKCQLNCTYCHELFNEKYGKENKFTQYDKLYQFLISIPLDDRVDVTITGGEITLSPNDFELIYKIFKKVEKNVDVKFDICVVTNGTNMKQIYEWFDKGYVCPFKTAISWDGLYSASKSRHTTLYTDEYFTDMIKELGTTKYNTDVAITTAITPMTIDDLYESYKFCLDNNVYNWGYYFIHEANYDNIKFQIKFKEQIEKIAQLYLEYESSNCDISYYNWQLIYSKRKEPKNFMLCHKLGNNYHIHSDGSIYPCIYFGDHRAFKIGDLENGIDYNEQQRFIDEYSIMPKCNYKICNQCQCSECPASNYVHNKSISKRFCNLCSILKIENEIYDKYALKTKKSNLYIPNDIYYKSELDNMKNCDIIEHNDTGFKSPNYQGVREW